MDKQTVENYSCKSCQREYEGSYCPNCGQKKIENRLVLKDSIRHFAGVAVNFERGLWYTSFMMYKKPRKVIDDYLNGATKPYIHPFRFLFVWLTISLFLMFSTGLFEDVQIHMAESLGQKRTPLEDHLNGIMQKYMQLFFVVSIPFLALGTKILFRKSRKNFAEHLVINSFCYGGSLVLSILVTPFYFISVEYFFTIQLLSLGLNIAVQSYFYKYIFNEKVIPAILKSILSYIFWIIGFFLSVAFFFIIYFVYLALTDPEKLKAFAGQG